ncbi:MAG: hypothetical protein H7236_04285 [Gemmatimonadaceae bacterium]|nr:hypothetical protein [Caulobacter sp.]
MQTRVAAGLGGLFSGLVNAAPLVGPPAGSNVLGQFAGVFLITWLQLMLVGALAAVIGVVTRSTMGAVVAGLVVVVAQSTLATMAQESTWKTLAIPAYAARLLKTFVAAPAGMRPEAGPAGLGLLLMALWLAALVAGALVLFKRQDLTKE